MAKYSSTDMSVTIGLTDMDFDNANRWQVATTAAFTVNPRQIIPPHKLFDALDVSINKNTRTGWLTRRRPMTGAIYPRG